MSDPRSVAVIGASTDRRKFGNKAVRCYLAEGFRVFPVHPTEKTIEGLQVYPSIDAIPFPVDYVSMYVPPAVGLKLLPAISKKEPEELWLNPGSENDDLVESATELGLRPITACSIVALGRSPQEFSDA